MQIFMKSCKSVGLYAKEGGPIYTTTHFCIQSNTFATFHNLANYEEWQKCETVCKSWGGWSTTPLAKVAKV